MRFRLRRSALCALALLAMAGSTVAWAAEDLTVMTADGAVHGEAIADGKIDAFLGLPFAAPPVGPLRWRSPQPEAPWSGVRDATRFGAHCLQTHRYPDMTFSDGAASEDCLYLNVYRPADASPMEKLPVMVWIHGGAYAGGSSSEPRHWGAILPQHGVVLVTINYRLGLFGFLATSQLTAEAGASGNYGLEDMVAALRWVKADIARFGGDPGNVTIFGESAGSFAVSTLMATPSAQGLFQKAIGESGAAFSSIYTLTLAAAEQKAAPWAAQLGGPAPSDLRALPAQTLLDRFTTIPGAAVGPVIDGDVLPERIEDAYAAGRQAHIPLLAGWNRDEGASAVKEMTAEAWTAFANKHFGDQASPFLGLFPAGDDAQARRSAIDYYSDLFIICGTWDWTEAHQRTVGSPIYRYQFDLAAPKSTFHDETAFHSDEIEYVFGTLDSRAGAVWRDKDRRLSAAMIDYWTNFARAGDPNGPGLPAWPAFSATGQVLHLDGPITVSADDRGSACRFLHAHGAL